MILKENETCPHAESCPYNYAGTSCKGSVVRKNKFMCSYVNEDGTFVRNGTIRNSNDQTGKMKVLMEN